MTDWTDFAKEHHYLSDEWLEYIIKSDGIVSDRGYKQICQNALDTRKQNKTLTAENERLKKDIEDIGSGFQIQFEFEDQLPKGINESIYSAMFACSHVDGVRLFPYIEENGERYYLISSEALERK